MTSKFKIVGSRFRPPAPAILACLDHHQPLTIRREPDNPHDPNAVAVWIEDFATDYPDDVPEILFEMGEADKDCPDLGDPVHLGYIPRDQAAELSHALLDLNHSPPARYVSVEGGPGVELGRLFANGTILWEGEAENEDASLPTDDEIPF